MFELQSRTCSTTNEGFYSLNGRQIAKTRIQHIKCHIKNYKTVKNYVQLSIFSRLLFLSLPFFSFFFLSVESCRFDFVYEFINWHTGSFIWFFFVFVCVCVFCYHLQARPVRTWSVTYLGNIVVMHTWKWLLRQTKLLSKQTHTQIYTHTLSLFLFLCVCVWNKKRTFSFSSVLQTMIHSKYTVLINDEMVRGFC